MKSAEQTRRLNSVQQQLLDLVRARPGATVGELASAMKETNPVVRNILYRLVERGLLVRQHVTRRVNGFKLHIGKVNVYFALDKTGMHS